MAATAIVLAAGAAERMGVAKQVLPIGGISLVSHVVEAARAAGFDSIRVVVGAARDEVVEALEHHDVEVVDNPDFKKGSFTSLLAGCSNIDGPAVVLVADMPRIDPAVIASVADELDNGAWGVLAEYSDGAGHPFGLSAELIAALPNEGPHRYLYELLTSSPRTRVIPVDAPRPADLNTPDDYRRAGGDYTF